MVKGVEGMGVCIRDSLKVKIPCSKQNDVAFYYDHEFSSSVFLREGDYAVVGYKDAHKPHIAAGKPMAVKKVVTKIPIF